MRKEISIIPQVEQSVHLKASSINVKCTEALGFRSECKKEKLQCAKGDVTLKKHSERKEERRWRLYFKMWGHSLMAQRFLSAFVPAHSPTAVSPFKLSLQFKGIKDASAALNAQLPMSLKY